MSIKRITPALTIFQDGDYLRIDAACPPVPHSSCNYPVTFEAACELRDYLSKFIASEYERTGDGRI